MVPLPLGLASVAAASERAGGHDVHLEVLSPGADWEHAIEQVVQDFRLNMATKAMRVAAYGSAT